MTEQMKRFGLTVDLNGGCEVVSGQELFAERERIKSSLETSLKRSYDNGLEMAEKTCIYRILLAQRVLELKAEGLQISIIEKVARGAEDVAQAEFEMIAAEVKYRASNENIMAQKKLFDSIEADIKREYYKGAEDG